MAIRFRCRACSGLMSIASRKAGAMVECPTCGEQTLVPMQDVFDVAPAAAVADPSSHVEPPEKDSSVGLVENIESAGFIEKMNSAEPVAPLHHEKNEEVDSDDEDGPALTLRRNSHGDDEMDLTPMVDVTFQLLIFFMVTASFALQKSIEVPNPDQDKKGAAQQLQVLDDIEATSIQVQIDGNNAILVDDEPVSDPSRLADVLRDKMRKDQKSELMITANAAAMHRYVIAVIDAANEVGMQKIRMVSRHSKSD